MKQLLNLSLELLATIFVLNVLVLFIPKGIRKSFMGFLHLVEMFFVLTFDIGNKIVTTAIKTVKNYEVPKQKLPKKTKTKQAPPSPSTNKKCVNEGTCKVINLCDKVKAK